MILDPNKFSPTDKPTDLSKISVFAHLEQVKMKSGYRTILEIELGLRRLGTGTRSFLDTYRLENGANGSDVAVAADSLNTPLSVIYLEFLTSTSKL